MLKKIIIIVIVVVIVISTISFSNFSTEENIEDEDVIVKSDVVMPTKVSRPGCEDIDRCYVPSLIVVEKGKQVTWVNEDSAFHSVTSGSYDSPTDIFDSGYLDPYESYSITFDETGTFDYFCTLHPWMKGQVLVE
ncbi:MAG: plastocyanin/azurin family copper-binding protein [Nitrosopumilus sp.]|nr:plastocyanin/azurin family copper-binding protein [Nitrosopumilus sp.]